MLYHQNNELTGPILESLSDCLNLVSLNLSFDYLNGTFPSSLGSLSNLRDLIFWLNQLHGGISEELTCEVANSLVVLNIMWLIDDLGILY